MRAYIHSQDSFNDRLRYCLEDKMVLDQNGQKQPLYKDRAEILYYNQCFGGKDDLIRQFNEVAGLNQNTRKPVFHITLALGDEQFSKSRWTEVSLDCARTMEFQQNQFVAILHKDKPYEHIHIVANRVGFDRRLVNDEFSFFRIDNFRHNLEIRYGLKQDVSHAQRLTNEQKIALRKDIRLDRLKVAISETLRTACDFPKFETEMQKRDLKVYKTEKGIAFRVGERVFFNGCEAGFSWKKIEAAFGRNQQQQELKQQLQEKHLPYQEPKLRHRISHHL